jgi:aldose 1-epimerase
MKIFSATLFFLLLLIQAFAASSSLIRLEESDFGELDDGSTVRQFLLRNANGMSVGVISYGAIITEIKVPDRKGNVRNIVAGSQSLNDYLGPFPAAAVIGRFANRIKDGRFEIDGQDYQVTQNARANHIHGGAKGFAKVNWSAEALPVSKTESGVVFSYFSKDGEEGYPGNLIATVTYTLNDQNELSLAYTAKTDKPTIVNLTNHAYFNLANGGGFEDHILWLNAHQYAIADSDLLPTGELATVSGSPFDFTVPQTIGWRLDQIGEPHPYKYDDNFVIKAGRNQLVVAARVHEPESGRLMEVRTDQPGVQLYTGNKHGFCLETQHYPDSINHPQFPSPIVRPSKPFKSTTQFVFSIQ